jgi:predicted nucleotidyltransferase
MKIVATIAGQAALKGLPFLVIGGIAVIAYEYPRMTRDLDLMVREEHRRAWDEIIVSLGYRAHWVQRVFHIYKRSSRDLPAVDLMLVDGATFDKLAANATEITMSGATVRVPLLKPLIALKLHALRGGAPHRRELDMGDILTLVQINNVDLASPEYLEILTRHATPEIAAELQRRLAQSREPGA